MVYKVYTESPTLRTTLQPTSGGISITQIQNVLQGIEVKTEREKNLSIKPLFSQQANDTDDVGYSISDKVDYFIDNDRFDPKVYIEVGTGISFNSRSFTENSLNDGSNRFDGSMAPFDIIGRSLVNYPFWPIVPHSSKGQLMGGTEQSFYKGSDQIMSIFERTPPPQNNPFYESGAGLFGEVVGSAIRIPGKSGIIERKSSPFNDATRPSPRIRIEDGVEKINGGDIINALLISTSSQSIEMMSEKEKSSVSGFDYFNNHMGTDSIAFGGFLR